MVRETWKQLFEPADKSIASPVNSLGPKNACVLVLGGGPIGLAVVQVLVALGTKKIIMSEVAASRQAFAREFGAHHVLDPRTYDLVALSRELSGGNGPDIVFDCAVCGLDAIP